jgi:putative intracellular protease/amidase
LPDAGIVVPAVTAGLAEIRESLPAAPWTKKRPSTPQRVVIVVVAGIAVLAAAWLITAMLDRRRQRKIDRDRKLTSATGERPLVADEPRAKGMDVPAAAPTAKNRRAIDQERVATDQERVATGLNGAREGTAVSVIEP